MWTFHFPWLVLVVIERAILDPALFSLAVLAGRKMAFNTSIDFRVRPLAMDAAIVRIATAYRLVFVIAEILSSHHGYLGQIRFLRQATSASIKASS